MNRETWLITGGAGYIGTHIAGTNVDLAATELGFKSKYSLEESIRSLF